MDLGRSCEPADSPFASAGLLWGECSLKRKETVNETQTVKEKGNVSEVMVQISNNEAYLLTCQ